jgi:hypothetical protein
MMPIGQQRNSFYVVGVISMPASIGYERCRHHRRIVLLSVLVFCIDRVICVYTLFLVLFMACMGYLCPSDVGRVPCVYYWRWAKGGDRYAAWRCMVAWWVIGRPAHDRTCHGCTPLIMIH